jgi:hypothetical protein
MRTFVVECYWPGMIKLEARATLDRVVRLGGEALAGQSVRLLGCIVLPSDGMALFLFNAPSEAVVKHIGGLAELPFDRVVESVLVGFGQQPRLGR